jgi:hypothetical protein
MACTLRTEIREEKNAKGREERNEEKGDMR